MTIDITEIIVAVISVLGAIVTAFVVPWIKTKTTTNQQIIIESFARAAVLAAQQIFGTEENQKKKDYAVQYITEQLKKAGITLDIDAISTVIEAALKAIKLEADGQWNNTISNGGGFRFKRNYFTGGEILDPAGS